MHKPKNSNGDNKRLKYLYTLEFWSGDHFTSNLNFVDNICESPCEEQDSNNIEPGLYRWIHERRHFFDKLALSNFFRNSLVGIISVVFWAFYNTKDQNWGEYCNRILNIIKIINIH